MSRHVLPNRLLSDQYDANGNTTLASLRDPVSGIQNPVSNSYDFEDRLIRRNNGAVQIVYDGDGNKVRETVNGTTSVYLVDDKNLTGYAQVVLEELLTLNGQLSTIRVYSYPKRRPSQNYKVAARLAGWSDAPCYPASFSEITFGNCYRTGESRRCRNFERSKSPNPDVDRIFNG